MLRVPLRSLLVALVVVLLPGCRARNGAEAGGTDASPVSSTSPTVGPIVTPETVFEGLAPQEVLARTSKMGRRPPPLAHVKKITLKQLQGGPSIMRCNGVVYELSFEPPARYVYGRCETPMKGPSTMDAPLVTGRGTYAPAALAAIEGTYAHLLVGLDAEGGNDGGTLSLEITRDDGVVERYVDMNWGNRAPAPQAARDLRALSRDLVQPAMGVGALR